MSFLPSRSMRRIASLMDLFTASESEREVTFGAEDERFYLREDGTIATPADTQHFLERRVAAGGVADRDPGSDTSASIARVHEARVTWSLEAAGVLELSTRPYRLSELNQFGADLAEALALRDAEMAELGLTPCLFSAPPMLSTQEAEARMVPSTRLRSLFRSFMDKDPDHPARFTMFQEAVSQISVAPRSLKHAGALLRRALQWAPLLYAATDNSSGFLYGKRIRYSPRSAEWARHNDFVPKGRERAGCPSALLDLLFRASDETIVQRYLAHVTHVPMVFHLDHEARPQFEKEKSFFELQSEGLGTEQNALLAMSLCWFDARIMPLEQENGRWMRVEVRSPDGGGAQSTWLAALLVYGCLVDEEGGAVCDEVFASSRVTPEGYLEARARLPEQGLDTAFGRTTLRALLPKLCEVALERCLAQGVNEGVQLQRLRSTR